MMYGFCSNALRQFVLLVSFIFVPCVVASAGTPERVVWDKKPIALHIQRGQERIIHFPDEIRYWLPTSLQNNVTALAANGVLYLQAHDSFPSTRIRVQGLSTNMVYLLDVESDEHESSSDELIIVEPKLIVNKAKSDINPVIEEDWSVRLTRYAAQQLYTPERLLKGDASVKRVAVPTLEQTQLIRGGAITAIPVASWKGGGLYVTAVKLINQSDSTIVITFNDSDHPSTFNIAKQLRGRWLTATPQHDYLGATGSREDTTVLYLLSKRPFVESFDFNEVQDDG